ncbi:MAG: ATP-binding protein [Chitinophagaceae bacterium]
MSQKQYALFDDRFLESFAGTSIIGDAKVAIIELIANSWDAGATKVEIAWPENEGDKFSIKDNGHGMTDAQFQKRFRTLAYNRAREQGSFAEVPEDHKKLVGNRPTFGKNGKGRLAGFAFGDDYLVKTSREGSEIVYAVSKDLTHTLSFQRIAQNKNLGHGTEVYVEHSLRVNISADDARKEIGMRFLTDPSFQVSLNSIVITFSDIPEGHIKEIYIPIEKIGTAKVTVVDVQTTDKTTQQHGIAWHVKRRLVGECTWKGSGSEYLIDGRRTAAKRFIFIVEADFLEDSVAPDWTMFMPSDSKWKKVSATVHEAIKTHLLEYSKSQREETFKEVEESNKNALSKLGIVPREKWEKFIKNVQEECPSIGTDDLEKVGRLLANLENTESKFGLINILATATSEDLDDLHELLSKWDIDVAKIVLDEIEYRTQLLEKLQSKVLSKLTDEVQELQPLFHRGLWIFGPEYETIEYTSNQGMTKVIQELFGAKDILGTRIRPDFAILPDSTVGLYSLPTYDDDGAESGIDRLTIVELKKPGIPIADEQKSQAWKYVSELKSKGLVKANTKIVCFVLGSEINPNDSGVRTESDGQVKIHPLNYDIIIRRAKSRLLNLYDKIKNSAFLQDTRVRAYMQEKQQTKLFE